MVVEPPRPMEVTLSMRILWYHHALDIGGAVNSIVLAGEISNLGHEVIIAADRGGLLPEVQNRHLTYREIPFQSHGKHPNVRTVHMLASLCRREKVNIIWTINSLCTLEAYWAAMSTGIPVFPLYGFAIPPRFPLPRIGLVGVNNPYHRDWFVRSKGFNPSHVRTIVARMDVRSYERFFLHRALLIDRPVSPMIGWVGRLSRDKIGAVCLFLDAVRTLWERNPEVSFTIVGDGDAGREVRKRAAEFNAGARGPGTLIWKGEVPFSDIPLVMGRLDIVCGMASTCIISMACGVPTVVLGNGGFSQIVAPENVDALAYRHFNIHENSSLPQPDTLVNQLLWLIGNPLVRRRLGTFCHQFACETYDVRKGARELLSVFEEAVATSQHHLGLHHLRELLRCTTSLYCYRFRRWHAQRMQQWGGSCEA